MEAQRVRAPKLLQIFTEAPATGNAKLDPSPAPLAAGKSNGPPQTQLPRNKGASLA